MTRTVVHLTASRFFGGPERQMLGLARALPPEIRSVFISFAETGLCRTFLEHARAAGCEAMELQYDTPRLAAACRELMGVLRRTGADLLCCHGYKADLLGLLAGRRRGVPVVSVSRGWTGECPRVRLYEALDRRVLRWFDRVICVSAAQAEKVRRTGVPRKKIVVIPNAVRPERFQNPDPDYRERLRRMFPDPVRCIVGAAGRLSPEKGFTVLIDAATAVVKAWPNVGFVVFGEGPLRTSLARRIAAKNMIDRFILAGFRSDLDCFLPQFDVMVLPSFTEGLPNVALEALAAGVPVVGTAVGGTPEVVEDGQTGCLTPPGNPRALADRILGLLGDDAARARMRLQGLRSVADRFSFAAQARAYVQVIDRLSPAPRSVRGKPEGAGSQYDRMTKCEASETVFQ
ncbi:MAG: glycosyltransferase [Pirellulales bacterium]|nr:glycosyltransferase [Pirellulales bacterium]